MLAETEMRRRGNDVTMTGPVVPVHSSTGMNRVPVDASYDASHARHRTELQPEQAPRPTTPYHHANHSCDEPIISSRMIPSRHDEDTVIELSFCKAKGGTAYAPPAIGRWRSRRRTAPVPRHSVPPARRRPPSSPLLDRRRNRHRRRRRSPPSTRRPAQHIRRVAGGITRASAERQRPDPASDLLRQRRRAQRQLQRRLIGAGVADPRSAPGSTSIHCFCPGENN